MIDVVSGGWSDVLTAFDLARPEVDGRAAGNWPAKLLRELVHVGLLRELPPMTGIACGACAEAPFLDVIFTETDRGQSRALIPCPNCGLYEVPLDELQRWQPDRTALIRLVRDSLSIRGRSNEIVDGRLWRLGRIQQGQTDWSVWLGFRLARRDAGMIMSGVRIPPQTLLLVPGRRPTTSLPDGVVVGALNTLTDWSSGELRWDREQLDELLTCHAAVTRTPAKPAPTRRQTRAADIEALVAELTQHLRTARDHAWHTRDTGGVAELLPRPTQKRLARRLGITESRVSRSINDPEARQLRLLWQLADDLDGILHYGR